MAARKTKTTPAERAQREADKQAKTAALIAAMKPEDQLRINTVLAPSRARAAAGYTATTAVAVTLSAEREAQLAQWNTKDSADRAVLQSWGQRLANTHKKVSNLNKQYRDLLYGFLQDAYAVYKEVEAHELSDRFYSNVRGALLNQGIKTQSNTPNASLVVRLIFGADASTKSVSEYGKVMQAAVTQQVKPDLFAEWLKKETLTKVLADQRAVETETETPKDRLDRARRVILRLLDIRETKPIIRHSTTAHAAEGMLGRHYGLCVAIGHASRRTDRSSFYADVNLSMVLPASLDFEIYIVDKLARYIMRDLEQYESQIETLSETAWGDQLYEQLVAAGDEEIDANNQYWSNRQQPAL
jgi:hypothetical protein